jgi:hypothetical protein
MIALNSSSLSRLPAAIRVPGYDRLRLHPGIVHIGVGSFHSPTRRSTCSGSSGRRVRLGHQRPRDPSAVLAATIHGGWFDDLDAPVESPQTASRPLDWL